MNIFLKTASWAVADGTPDSFFFLFSTVYIYAKLTNSSSLHTDPAGMNSINLPIFSCNTLKKKKKQISIVPIVLGFSFNWPQNL